MTRYVQDQQTKQWYETFNAFIGSASPGVTVTSATAPPASIAGWFISTSPSADVLNAKLPIFQYTTQANQRFRFVVQSNAGGPYWWQITLNDSAGTPTVQTGNLYVYVYDTTLNRVKCTLLNETSARGAVSGTPSQGGLIPNTLTYTFGSPDEEYVTDPGDVIQVVFQPTLTGQNGVYAPSSTILLKCEILSPSSGPTSGG